MIITLLILIAAILLFGATKVRHALGGCMMLIGGLMLVTTIVLLVGPLFGSGGSEGVVWCIIWLFLLLAAWALITGEGRGR